MPTPYQRRNPTASVLHWTGDNLDELNQFAGREWRTAGEVGVTWRFEVEGTHVCIFDSVVYRWVPVPLGFYIVKTVQGLQSMNKEMLDVLYEPVMTADGSAIPGQMEFVL